MTEIHTINLDDLTGNGAVHNLSGHERGVDARRMYRLDDLDASGAPVAIKVPDHIYGLSPSFLQGLLSASVVAAGKSRERFFRRFSVIGTDLAKRQIDRGIDAIMTDRDFSG